MHTLKERRRYPRYKVKVPVTLQLADGELALNSTDICYQGIRVQCPKDEILRVVPRGAQFTPDEHISIPMQLDLGMDAPLSLSGEVTFCHRQSQYQFQLGFNFETLGAVKKQSLMTYLDTLEGVTAHQMMFN